MNVYDDLSIDKKTKKVKNCVWMNQIGLYTCFILEKTFLYLELTILLQENHNQKRWNISRRE